MHIGELIKAAREEGGLTQAQAAEALLVTRQTVSNWETGKSLPDILSLLRMRQLYQISLDALLTGDADLMEKIRQDALRQRQERRVVRFGGAAAILGITALGLGSLWRDTPFWDFFSAALPWVLLGLSLLLSLTVPEGPGAK